MQQLLRRTPASPWGKSELMANGREAKAKLARAAANYKSSARQIALS
jgi:hypothetical protein